jgi:D-glycero-D-manno-heptose 1,7-bisphosphate phosphatase
MSTSKLLILDKDGTLVTPASGAKFVQHPQDQVLLPGVAEAIARYAASGWTIAIASNQVGVASEHKMLGQTIDEMSYCLELLPSIELVAFAHSFEDQDYGECVFIDARDHGFQWKIVTNARQRFRKPSDGMIDLLASTACGDRLWRNKMDVLMVGDRLEDEGAAQTAAVRFMWADEWREGDR